MATRSLLLALLCLGGCDDSKGRASVSELSLTPTTATLLSTETQAFQASATYSDGSTRDVTTLASWSSSDPSVATIDSAGHLLAVAAGTTQVHAALDGVSSPSSNVTVRGVISLAVTEPGGTTSAQTVYRTNVQFTATANLSDITTLDVTKRPSIVWSSTAPNIATIGTDGVAMPGNNSGFTEIKATLAGQTGTAQLVVSAPP